MILVTSVDNRRHGIGCRRQMLDIITDKLSKLHITVITSYFFILYITINFIYTSMASPLSTIISHIYLQNLQQSHINKLKHDFDVVFYGRFVENILVIYENKFRNPSYIQSITC